MRVDLEAMRQALGTLPSLPVAKLAAGGAATLAAATVLYVAWPQKQELPVDAVVSTAAPVFTPVTWKPAVAATAPASSAPSPAYDDEGRAIDMRDPVSVTRAVQRHLKQANCYDGRINGVWNTATRRGMAAFTEIVNARLPVDRADPVLLVLLETHDGVTCTEATPASARRTEEVASIDRATDAHAAKDDEHPSPQGTDVRDGQDARDDAHEKVAAIEETSPEGAAPSPADDAAAAAAAAAATRKVAKSDRPRYKRKYRRGPSLSRSFRQFQRSMKAIFF